METESLKRVAVVGAGCSGLLSIKNCIEVGLAPVCFERSDDIGGLWRYRSETKDYTEASVMKSTVINTSKEMMAFSDFPPPKEFPNFMHHEKIMEYFRMYTTHFKLWPHIKFHTEVLNVMRSDDYEKTGRWSVTYKEKGKEEVTEVFDGVMLCSGHHAIPHFGQIPGLDQFSGKVTHSYKYKNTLGYEDKTVVVIGTGNSGGDIAVELSYTAKQVILAARTGTWVHTRATLFGYPFDCVYFSRMGYGLYYTVPKFMERVTEVVLTKNFDHRLYGLQPPFPPLRAHPFANDTLPGRILAGRVSMKPDVAGFEKRRIIFQDKTSADDIDEVILCTGFDIGFPYLENDLLYLEDNKVHLYKLMYPPDLPHHSLAVIGLIQPHGAILPIAEMQTRVFAHALKGDIKLPNREAMEKDILKLDQYNLGRFPHTRRHTIQVDYIPLCDELAELLGASVPSLYQLLLTDPKLAYATHFGSGAPYQYRLAGPNAWAPARQHMLTVWDRIQYPLLPEGLKNSKKPNGSWVVQRTAIAIVSMVVITFLFFFLIAVKFICWVAS